MAVREFRDDNGDRDDDFLAWLAANPGGYVINILRSYSVSGARLHRASCRTINGQNPGGGKWIGQYAKVCAPDPAEIDQWAVDRLGEPIVRCGICHPKELTHNAFRQATARARRSP
ncbi:hypothetical protein AU196_10660 [Mycobacterium sp. IS-1742]|uniref:hypothetical protein n=1 Tax=Mycobacterium sp. IS-1742 TaxID=1772285 RepID=UPI00073FE18C|nr:hypothetical protein [Mycobacterium sp. IS-1742]KUI31609.1 hypothetical protein AU196_10660 [Mycobacterium sp. IS-1742]